MTTTQETMATGTLLDRGLGDFDPEVAAAVTQELRRQQSTLEMIASENFAPTRGFDADAFDEVADIIAVALRGTADAGRMSELRVRVEALASRFPLYPRQGD